MTGGEPRGPLHGITVMTPTSLPPSVLAIKYMTKENDDAGSHGAP